MSAGQLGQIPALLRSAEEAVLRTFSCVFGLALLLSAWAQAEDADRHLADGDPGSVCRQSAYIHGYIHGYESGFRVGDLDYHLGREPRAVHEIKEYRHVSGYRSGFGDENYFRLGYRQGFRAAYDDALRGIAFRGINQLRQAARGQLLNLPEKELDRAVSAGYDAGYSSALNGSIPSSRLNQPDEHCLAAHNGDYCDGYARGFRLGYSDGFVVQNSDLTQTANLDPCALALLTECVGDLLKTSFSRCENTCTLPGLTLL